MLTGRPMRARGAWLLLAVCLVAVACGDSESDPDSAEVVSTSEPRTLDTTGGGAQSEPSEVIALTTPDMSTELKPGTYETTSTDRPVQFTIGEGWYLGGQAPWVIGLAREPNFLDRMLEVDNLFVGFFTKHISVPADPLGGRPPDMEWEPAPDDLMAWFESIPGVEVVDPQPVTVGGIDGTRFDLEIGPLPDTADCGEVRCVNIGGALDGLVIQGFEENTTVPMVVLGEPGDAIVIAAAVITPGFDELADEVIASLEFV